MAHNIRPAVPIHNAIFKPSMCTYSKRIKTFENWPSSKTQTLPEVAKCEFYYIGEQDRVICYYCGLALHGWFLYDHPWLKHAIHSRKCPFLHLNKYSISEKNPSIDVFPTILVYDIMEFLSLMTNSFSFYNQNIYYLFLL